MKKLPVQDPPATERVWRLEGLPVLKLSLQSPPPPSDWSETSVSRIQRYYQLQARACQRRCERLLLPLAREACRASLEAGVPPLCFQAELEHHITRNSGGLWSLYTQLREKSGAGLAQLHRWGDTWEQRTGYPVSLSRLFPPGAAWRRLLPKSAAAAMEAQLRAGTACWREDWRRQVRRCFEPRSFYLTETGLCFFYPMYALGPAAEGIPVFTLPYSPEGPFLLPR